MAALPPTQAPRPRVLECCCCGNGARGRQWHNRDTGYGLCGRCATSIQSRPDYDPDDFTSCYGVEGVHWFTENDPRGNL